MSDMTGTQDKNANADHANSPWGGGGNDGGKGQSPWGQGSGPKTKPRPKSQSEQQQEIDNVIRGFKERFGGGGKGGGGRGTGGQPQGGGLPLHWIILGVGLVLMLISSVYQVAQQEEAVILRFGKYSRTTTSGLHVKMPSPFERAYKIDVTTERAVGSTRNLVLTGDENIADIDFTVRWKVKEAMAYMFNLEDPDSVVEDAAESALREVIGKKELDAVITTERGPIEIEVKALVQAMLDQYGAGIDITVVQLQRAAAPPKVIKSFEDVVTAEQELDQRVNEGLSHKNQVTENAVGAAAQVVESAEAYKSEVVSIARGEASRFTAVYKEYKAAPRVTRQRIYLEAMEEIYRDADKIILDEKAGSGVVPYLPLDSLKKSGGQ